MVNPKYMFLSISWLQLFHLLYKLSILSLNDLIFLSMIV